METLDQIDNQAINKEPNTILHVMCILGYIANGFWILMSLVILFIGSSILPDMIPNSRVDSDQFMTAMYIGFALIMAVSIIAIFGLVLAHQKKKVGVIIYGIANGLWAVINLVSLQPANLIFAVISIAFIIVIAMNYNK